MELDSPPPSENTGETSAPIRLETIVVSTLVGEDFELSLPGNSTARAAKDAILERLGFPVLEQRLIFGIAILDNDVPLPFSEAADTGQSLQVVRVAHKLLPDFATEHNLSLSKPDDVKRALRLAAQADQPTVCMEAVLHEQFIQSAPCDQELRWLTVGGLFEPFHELLQSARYSDNDGRHIVQTSAYDILRDAAKRGLPLHCNAILECPSVAADAVTGVRAADTPLHHAANEHILRLLLGSDKFLGAEAINKVDRHGCTCLHYATTEGSCRAILEHPAFVSADLADGSGSTALHFAKRPRVCAAILGHADFTAINARDYKGCTALHYAVRSQELTSIILNCERLKADIDAADNSGKTALHYARSDVVCELLFAAGLTAVDSVDILGQTALHKVVSGSVARVILSQPTCQSQYIKDRDGNTPLLVMANERRSQAVLEILNFMERHPCVGDLGAVEALAYENGLEDEAQAALRRAANRPIASGRCAPNRLKWEAKCSLL